jgi:holo-[acyl-carrier protein] synthase
MILGLGVDLCSIPRMEKAARSSYFVKRLFHPVEIAYADGKGGGKGRASSLAAAFAAREAFAKASGVSLFTLILASRFHPSRFHLERTEGVPRLVIPPDLDAGFAAGKKRAWVSLSHEGDYVVAIVAIEAIEAIEAADNGRAR